MHWLEGGGGGYGTKDVSVIMQSVYNAVVPRIAAVLQKSGLITAKIRCCQIRPQLVQFTLVLFVALI